MKAIGGIFRLYFIMDVNTDEPPGFVTHIYCHAQYMMDNRGLDVCYKFPKGKQKHTRVDYLFPSMIY